MGMRRCRETRVWRLMERYESLRRRKGSGKSIIATARNVSTIVWYMLSSGKDFDESLMIDKKLKAKTDQMHNASVSVG